uniref:Uncharacterized protein n=1 Tax=Setaria viridis TaxID=4556 RepID=A0A4U6UUJ1_SETVI|nr:uncharacterized protein LOC117851653 isoform X4 [Setaria viridis]TKW20220.1 hypothetical protein SEVIR_4G071800v2 [Setaria viridis]TKW20221.1 hypothetical protein SEVIR_4G071800v2 [Setaria viridis]
MVVWRPREHGDVPARRRFPEFPRHGYCSPRSRRSRSISSRGQRRALFQAAAPPLPTMPKGLLHITCSICLNLMERTHRMLSSGINNAFCPCSLKQIYIARNSAPLQIQEDRPSAQDIHCSIQRMTLEICCIGIEVVMDFGTIAYPQHLTAAT